MPRRITIGVLLGIVALAAANCSIVRICLYYQGANPVLFGATLGFLPLINASLLGVLAIANGYRMTVRRRSPEGRAPFFVRFGFSSLLALLASIAFCVFALDVLQSHVELAERLIDEWAIGLGIVSGPIDYGPVVPGLLGVWTVLSAPQLMLVGLMTVLTHRYQLVIQKRA